MFNGFLKASKIICMILNILTISINIIKMRLFKLNNAYLLKI